MVHGWNQPGAYGFFGFTFLYILSLIDVTWSSVSLLFDLVWVCTYMAAILPNDRKNILTSNFDLGFRILTFWRIETVIFFDCHFIVAISISWTTVADFYCTQSQSFELCLIIPLYLIVPKMGDFEITFVKRCWLELSC